MSYGDCWVANPGWHPDCKGKHVSADGRLIICDSCLCVCTFADTWVGLSIKLTDKDGYSSACRGPEAVFLCAPEPKEVNVAPAV